MVIKPLSEILSAEQAEVASAAKIIVQSGRALALIHAAFDDSRYQGLPPHHAITRAIDKLARGK